MGESKLCLDIGNSKAQRGYQRFSSISSRMGGRARVHFWMLGLYRRLSKDFEGLPESSEAMIYVAMSHLMVRRLARIQFPTLKKEYSDTL